jgi:nucleotide sugar dehydrogenase
VARADKLVAGLHPDTPALIARLYSRIVTNGTLHQTNSMTAEVVKTLENAYRDVRIACAAEVVRFCDARGIDFFALRDAVNARLSATDRASLDPTAVPVGDLLVPVLGVGGHCLPKDGVLLWWRRLRAGDPEAVRSLILESRRVNDESPAATLSLADRSIRDLHDRRVALLGVAYRGDSEDTRNSPTLALATLLLDRHCSVILHDPHVKPGDANLVRTGLAPHFTRDLLQALAGADVVFACAPHRAYLDRRDTIAAAPAMRAFVDACHLVGPEGIADRGVTYCGIGRGTKAPAAALVDFVVAGFRAVERGVAREVAATAEFLNARHAATPFQRVEFAEVRRLAATCTTGCAIAEALPPEPVAPYEGFLPRLVALALS